MKTDEVVHNLSYELTKNIDSFSTVTIQSNPSYGITNHHRRISDGYVEPNEFTQNPLPFHTVDYVNMDDDRSFGVESRSDIVMTPNPSYDTVPQSNPIE